MWLKAKSKKKSVHRLKSSKSMASLLKRPSTETVKKTVSTPQVTKHKLYNDAGEEIGEHEVPVIESYTISPAVEAVAEQTETVVVTRAESNSRKSRVERYSRIILI